MTIEELRQQDRQKLSAFLRLERALHEGDDADWIMTGIRWRVLHHHRPLEAITLTLDAWEKRATHCSICRGVHISDDRHPCE